VNSQSQRDPQTEALETVRQRLWQQRLAIEEKASKCNEVNGMPKPYRETNRVLFAQAVLKALGLYNRGMRNVADLRLNTQTLYCQRLPAAFDGFRMLLLSDFHFAGDRAFVERVCNLVRSVDADLCVMTGDYRYSRRAPDWDLYEGMEEVLAAIRAPYGVVGVLGNNDTGSMVAQFRAMGVQMLINQPLEIVKGNASLWLGGVDDPHEYGCGDLRCAFEAVPGGAFRGLLAHSPELADQAAAASVDVYLCGHTHGGQICLPRLGPMYVNCRCPKERASGPWQAGLLQGYTTRGLNASTLPVRYNCPPEATLIVLTKP